MELSHAGSEGTYSFDGRKLHHSRFNVNWLTELGITPRAILDIGAFDCGDAIRFKTSFPDSKVIAFEADPDRAANIQSYIENYGVEFFPVAISDKCGTIDFYPSIHTGEGRTDGQGSLLKHSDVYKQTFGSFIKQQPPVQVQTRTVEDVNDNTLESIDLVHIDVEGYEYGVIKGFGKCRPKLVFFETILDGVGWEGTHPAIEIHELLNSMGYILLLDLGTDRLYQYILGPDGFASV